MSSFARMPDGEAIELYTLANARGMQARISTYGGILTALSAPDRDGRYANIVLGFESFADYLADQTCCGALIGRYAGRIAHGSFTLHRSVYSLPLNDGANSLHGGARGFFKLVWQVVDVQADRLVLQRVSHDGDQGYPGSLKVRATYTLKQDDALQVDFTASTDRSTVLNLTQHPYFNLRGRGDVLDHELQIHASRFTPLDGSLIPTGELCSVAGSPLDFRSPRRIGAQIESAHPQLRLACGYDHNWVIDGWEPGVETLLPNATVYEPDTGRVLEVSSTQPGLQFYSGNTLPQRRTGLALEPQHFPDSPNQPQFPRVVLEPGERYAHTMVYRFSNRG